MHAASALTPLSITQACACTCMHTAEMLVGAHLPLLLALVRLRIPAGVPGQGQGQGDEDSGERKATLEVLTPIPRHEICMTQQNARALMAGPGRWAIPYVP